MKIESHTSGEAAVVSGGNAAPSRAVAQGLASWGWPVVLVYLDRQRQTEAILAEIITAGGDAVAVRADLDDDLDMQRLFAEASAAFGDVAVVAHMTSESATFLYQHAAQAIRERGVIVSTTEAAPIPPLLVERLRARGITVGRVPSDQVLALLDRWRQESAG
jgi:hypothetical protein